MPVFIRTFLAWLSRIFDIAAPAIARVLAIGFVVGFSIISSYLKGHADASLHCQVSAQASFTASDNLRRATEIEVNRLPASAVHDELFTKWVRDN